MCSACENSVPWGACLIDGATPESQGSPGSPRSTPRSPRRAPEVQIVVPCTPRGSECCCVPAVMSRVVYALTESVLTMLGLVV